MNVLITPQLPVSDYPGDMDSVSYISVLKMKCVLSLGYGYPKAPHSHPYPVALEIVTKPHICFQFPGPSRFFILAVSITQVV